LEISVTSDNDDHEGNGGEFSLNSFSSVSIDNAVAGKDLRRSDIDGGHPFDVINQSQRLESQEPYVPSSAESSGL
jgi:hypothetical protein